MTHEEKCTSSERPGEDAEKFADQLRDIEQRAAEMKIVRGLANYGRAEIRIPLHNLFGLFDGKNVGIVYVEYDIRAEQLCFIVEGDGLPRHPEGSRPFVVPGRFTGGSYIMADVRGEWVETFPGTGKFPWKQNHE